MAKGRMRRVDEAIRQVIGDALASDLKDPRVGFVTVTDVKTSPDLSHARVYVSVLADGGSPQSAVGDRRSSRSTVGAEQAREETMAGLRHAHGFLQRRIAGELRLKRTPTLEFAYDDTSERAMRLDALIDSELAGLDKPGAGASRSEGAPLQAQDATRGDRSQRGSKRA